MTVRRQDETFGAAANDLAQASLALARRFANGATLWCWAPDAAQHAQHVAVEFVHPVIVGTHALPAVAVLDDADVAASLRPLAAAGDVLLVVAAPDPRIDGLLRRAEAWGLTTIWLGAGARPGESTAHHTIWLGDDPAALYDGRAVLGYHVLWELTHVCFEHPGLLRNDECADDVCITCSDEGRLAEVVTAASDDAVVRSAKGVETISTLMVGPVEPGDLVLVHAGTAITVVDA